MATATATTEVLASARAALDSHAALVATVRASQANRKQVVRSLPSPPDQLVSLPPIPQRSPSPDSTPSSSPSLNSHLAKQLDQLKRNDLLPTKLARVAKYQNYVPEEETIRNDYSQQYVDSGEWPQNWVLGAELERRFEEYPKQQKLLALKRAAVDAHAHRPSYLPMAQLSSLHPRKFDVILIDPQYTEVAWEQLLELPIPALSADPSFVFLWVGHGSSDGLERGRELLAKWGFRRCEDIVWVKTNKTANRGPGTDPPPIGGLLTRTTEHCLMGIRGTVRRSTDSWLVHCNIDTDVIIWEGDPADPLRKPPEMYSLVENFCLGTRRLEIFGRASSLRRGWVTLGSIDNPQGELARVNGVAWDREWWEGEIRAHVGASGVGKAVVPTSGDIDGLRPKSPVRNNDRGNGNNPNGGGANAMGGMGTMAMQGGPMRLVPNQGNMQMGMQVPPQGMMGGMGGVGVMNPPFVGAPMPQAAFGFDGPQQMSTGGMGMNPIAGGLGVPMNAMGTAGMAMPKPNPIQNNPPIRLGGGPMQGMGMGVNMSMGGSPGMPAALPNTGGMGMGGGGMAMNVGMAMGGPPGMMQPAMGMGMAPNPAMGMNTMGRNMSMMGMQQGMGMGMGMPMPMNANMNMNMGMGMGMMGAGSGPGMMGQGMQMQMQGLGGGPMRFNPQQQHQQQQGRPTSNQGF